MAQFIQTNDVENKTPTIGTGAEIRNAQYGIDALLSGYIIQNVSNSKARVYDETYSQKNSLISELDTDEQWTLTMEVIGGDGSEQCELPGIVVGQTDLEWDDHLWKVRSCVFNGTYNDKKRYSLELFRSTNFPQES